MQETLTFPTLAASPSRFAFPDPHYDHQLLYSAISSTASTPFVSAPSSPSRMKGFYFSAPTSPTWVQRTLQMQEDDHEDGSPHWAQKKLQIKPDGGRPDCAQKSQQMKGSSCPSCAQITRQMKHDSCTNWAPMPAQPPMKNDAARHKAHTRLLIEDADASSIPYASEEKSDGTPKTRANFEANNNSEEDSSSILLSGSSEFEFSARFSEMEEPPMSPTPISSSSSSSFKHHAQYGSPGTSSELAYGNPKLNEAAYEEQIWPARPTPRLDASPVRPLTCKDEAVEIKHRCRSLTSVSAPQSPCSPGKFGLRRPLRWISNPPDTSFDPHLAAMEKIAKNSDDFAMGNDVSKNARNSCGHHSRAQSSSPLSIFHWDEHPSKSNSSSNDSFMHEIKDNHHNQKKTNARNGPSISSKGVKGWSFKGFFHRKSTNGLPKEASRSSNTTSLRSSGRSSFSSSMEESNDVNITDDNAKVRGVNMDDNAKVRGVNMDANARIKGPNVDDNAKFRSINSPVSRSNKPSKPSSSSSSPPGPSSRGKLTAHKVIKGPYALHYTMQRAHTEELRRRTFLPYKQGLFGCLGFSSKSYGTITTHSKPLQSVS